MQVTKSQLVCLQVHVSGAMGVFKDTNPMYKGLKQPSLSCHINILMLQWRQRFQQKSVQLRLFNLLIQLKCNEYARFSAFSGC